MPLDFNFRTAFDLWYMCTVCVWFSTHDQKRRSPNVVLQTARKNMKQLALQIQCRPSWLWIALVAAMCSVLCSFKWKSYSQNGVHSPRPQIAPLGFDVSFSLALWCLYAFSVCLFVFHVFNSAQLCRLKSGTEATDHADHAWQDAATAAFGVITVLSLLVLFCNRCEILSFHLARS